MLSRRLAILAAVWGLWALPGCGGGGPTKVPLMSVKGTVTLSGAPLTEGTVSFSSSATGNGAIAHLGPEGKFVVTGGIVAGDYKVVITPPTPTPDNPEPKKSDIPDKYRNEATTDLTAKITTGANDLKFDLKP